MTAVPSTHTVTGTIATTSEMNTYFRDPLVFLLNPPVAELRQAVAQTLTTSTFTAVTFDVEDIDTASGHDTSSNTSRYTAVYPGKYQVSGAGAFANNTTGIRLTQIRVNGSVLNGSRTLVAASGSGASALPVATRMKHVALNVGDYVEIYVYQDTGGNLLTSVSTDEQSSMTVRWVSN